MTDRISEIYKQLSGAGQRELTVICLLLMVKEYLKDCTPQLDAIQTLLEECTALLAEDAPNENTHQS